MSRALATLACGCALGAERCFDCRYGLHPDQEKALAISLQKAGMTPADVKAFFSLPDDDDAMHSERGAR